MLADEQPCPVRPDKNASLDGKIPGVNAILGNRGCDCQRIIGVADVWGCIEERLRPLLGLDYSWGFMAVGRRGTRGSGRGYQTGLGPVGMTQRAQRRFEGSLSVRALCRSSLPVAALH